MKPPPGTTWAMWTAVCPVCSMGFSCSNGLEFERILRGHNCNTEDGAA